MQPLPREVKRLLVELAFAAANQRLRGEIDVFLDTIDLLIDDEQDRAICRAHLYMQSGRLVEARACLGERNDPPALLLAMLIAAKRDAAAAPRVIGASPRTRH
ncbi:DUF1039 domain-containing protein [Cupriavidus gilardii]|uniref:DUF1039 domain-containing protein n=1 Tax=Cupriavidus gilardii TaxID=82541 RepID=UPI001573F16D|nr:DUF1039 domain-containing protein [Cupriavidus gilardii]MDF9429083.1 DUF1039 domain-containing protein [Cupriavidus gilardii]NSX05773.1 DUF1039 domain-containing protein [Cupriavidus gilardii]